jgi:hypothetical protein
VDGVTRIGPVDAAGRPVVEKGLMSVAELHRSGQMRPESGGPALDRGLERLVNTASGCLAVMSIDKLVNRASNQP